MKTVLLAVGISHYQSEQINDLSVCDKDAQAVAAAFQAIAGDALEQRLLLDQQATKQGIQAGIDWLATTARKGDLAIFYYSGHGASNPDRDGDDADGNDEFLCPHDCGTAPGLTTFIRDDELRGWLRAVGKKTNRVVVILDSCHSGTAAMAPQRAIAKELPPGVVQALIGDERAPKGKRAADPKVKGLLLLAGCQDSEQSYILTGAPNSAFTAQLLAALRDRALTTFQALYTAVAPQIAEQIGRLGLRQNPNIVDGTDGALAFR
jgi:uncharacterized caspase-like protein